MNEPGTRTLAGGLAVGPIGLGCMGMSWAYSPSHRDRRRSVRVIRQALDAGVTLLDTADVYGPGANEELVAHGVRGRRDQVVLATKCGLVPRAGRERPVPDGRPAHIHAAVDASLRRLGTDHIDLYYLHRVDPRVPLAESWGAMAELVAAGKVRHVGLSEVSAQQLRLAHATHPVACVQSELSLWTRDHLAEVLPACRAASIGFVAFAALGRGFLTGNLPPDLEGGDLRTRMPRFAPQAQEVNRRALEVVGKVARSLGATPAQVALAWVLAQGPQVVALAGTTRPEHLAENLQASRLQLTRETLAELDRLPAPVGERY